MQSVDLAQSSCGRCRDRRVKCDRQKPGCQRCEKYSQPCPGYERKRPFRDEGPGLEKKFSRSDLGDRFSVTLSRSTEMPSTASPPTTISPIADPSTAGTSAREVQSEAPLDIASTSDARDWVMTNGDRFFDLDPAIYYTLESNACGANPAVTQRVSESQPATPSGIEPTSPSNGEENATPEVADEDHRETTFLPLLIRRFVEIISPWLDIFDAERYFGYVVPVRACHSRLLRDSLAAVAARQLANFDRGKETQHNRDSATRSATLDSDATLSVDWSFQAASFYDRAIRSMIKALGSITRPMPTEIPVEGHIDQLEGIGDLLAAMPILLAYELMDSRHSSMVQHMAGAHHLLQLALQQHKAMASNDSLYPHVPDNSLQRVWKASFWSFVSFDYIISYTGRSKPRLGVTATRLWQASGLPFTLVGEQLIPMSLVRDIRSGSPKMTETVACRTLLWILLRILDSIVMDEQPPEHCQAHQRTNFNCLLGMSAGLCRQVDQYLSDWYTALPNTFEPCLGASQPQLGPAALNNNPGNSVRNLDVSMQGWFIAHPMGAVALPLYHFSRILLILHSPLSGVNRLRIYRQISQQVKQHAIDICSAAGQPPQAAQMHLIQPLHLAGLCLDTQVQRSSLEDLLVRIQRQTGFSTAEVLLQLKEDWLTECSG